MNYGIFNWFLTFQEVATDVAENLIDVYCLLIFFFFILLSFIIYMLVFILIRFLWIEDFWSNLDNKNNLEEIYLNKFNFFIFFKKNLIINNNFFFFIE